MTTQKELELSAVFEQLTNIQDELYQTMSQSLTIHPKEDQPFQDFASPDGNVKGSLLTFSGELIDKLIHTKMNALKMGFGTARLTFWLNSSVLVPHLAFEFGTMPNLFFYMDYIPRVDLWSNLDYFQDYYDGLNSTYLELRDQSELSLFVSKSLYVRAIQSPAHICFTGTNTKESLALVRQLSQKLCDRWLSWVQQATRVPEAHRQKIAERDLRMRRISAERDPGNATVARAFGEDFTDQLVKALWQKEPVNPDAD